MGDGWWGAFGARAVHAPDSGTGHPHYTGWKRDSGTAVWFWNVGPGVPADTGPGWGHAGSGSQGVPSGRAGRAVGGVCALVYAAQKWWVVLVAHHFQ